MRTARITTMTTTTARWVAARPVGPRSILQSVVATHPKNNQNQQQSGTTSNTSNTNYYTNKSYTTTTTSTTTTHYSIHTNNRRLLSSFTWAGPRKLREILNVDNYNNDCGRQDDDSRLVSTPRQKKGGGRVRDAWEAHHLDQVRTQYKCTLFIFHHTHSSREERILLHS